MNKIFTVSVLSLVIALVAGIATVTMVPQAFAENTKQGAQDDKNNPTNPGGQIGKDSPPDNAKNGHAIDNRADNCQKHSIEGTGPSAQCY